ncbi:hypothetical protein OPAG_01786 [Rhodococcus opacus PD630]|nr:hypothetical protein OPAG_01786 [Rhodococcus opacus PD630]RYF60971.1 MAG: hypothetical protein EOO27_03855 [Comamonadaceae bacterium]
MGVKTLEAFRRGAVGGNIHRVGRPADSFGSIEVVTGSLHGQKTPHTPNGILISTLDEARARWLGQRIPTPSGRFVPTRLEIDYRTTLQPDDRRVRVRFIALRADRTGAVLREIVQNSNTQRVIAEAVSEVELWDASMSSRLKMSDEQLAALRRLSE